MVFKLNFNPLAPTDEGNQRILSGSVTDLDIAGVEVPLEIDNRDPLSPPTVMLQTSAKKIGW